MAFSAAARRELRHEMTAGKALAPPPGEVAQDELTGAETARALEGWFKAPRMTLADIAAYREGRWVVLRFTFRKASQAGWTVKVSTAWATVLWQRLARVLDK